MWNKEDFVAYEQFCEQYEKDYLKVSWKTITCFVNDRMNLRSCSMENPFKQSIETEEPNTAKKKNNASHLFFFKRMMMMVRVEIPIIALKDPKKVINSIYFVCLSEMND